ncbi:MAG: hypothetical protein ACD_26C00043G0001 [uncultured bacterium]|nr:MAG: hypothetical protein ACD_26C00043G0001 [uncultured bacterium]
MNFLLPFFIAAFLLNSVFLCIRDRKIYINKIPKFNIFVLLLLTVGSVVSLLNGRISLLSYETLLLVSFSMFTLTSGNFKK